MGWKACGVWWAVSVDTLLLERRYWIAREHQRLVKVNTWKYPQPIVILKIVTLV